MRLQKFGPIVATPFLLHSNSLTIFYNKLPSLYYLQHHLTWRSILKYVEPAPLGSGEEPKLVTTTIQEYDNNQLRSLYKTQLVGMAMMAVMHLYFKYTNPLLIQSILPVKGAFEGNLIKVHVFGK